MSSNEQQDATEGGLVTFKRNGSAKQSGDARYTLDPDVGDVELFGKREQPVVVIPLGDGHIVRKTMPRNVYVPSGDVDESVEAFTLRVTLDSIQRSDAKTPKGSAEGASIASILAKGGQREALIEYLIRTESGVGPKTAPGIADGLIAAAQQ